MTRDLGFILTYIDNSPFYDNLLIQISKLIHNNPYNQICIFNSACDKLDTYNVPILHMNQSKYFMGDLFVFDIMSLCLIKTFPMCHTKYFYLQDIPWNKYYNKYIEWINIFDQNNLKIITKNQEIYDLYDIAWGKPEAIMENMDYEKLSQIIQ